jgi:hypothetical protein
MNLQPPGPSLRAGEYIVTRGADTEAERNDARATLRRNGCKSVRFEPLNDGRLQVHGYLSYVAGAVPV